MVGRWYAPSLGTFLSEASLLGRADNPQNRQLYAYGAGDAIDRADADGRLWYKVRPGDTLSGIAYRYLGSLNRYPEV